MTPPAPMGAPPLHMLAKHIYILAVLKPSTTDLGDYFTEETVTKVRQFCSDAGLYVETSSSAVAKRPRDASCLSVVSFNSTKRRVESFIVSYAGYRFITACS